MMTKFVVNQTAILSCFKFIPQLIEKRDSKTGSDASDEICRISEKVTSCMDIKAKELCGEKSVPFVRSYLQATIKPLMRGVTCNNGQTTIKQQWTSVMIFVTLIICLYNIFYE
ncbi:uncharacterized protein LOC134242369 [Saccostrea cucullata]|uniref:uncharacterized protein LOC134242369 n=1 Tax=Saccostrea cuccullata TaxID=36930 RepID=UPI002ED35B04